MRSVEAVWRVLYPGLSPTRKPIDSAIWDEARRMKDSGSEIEVLLRFLGANRLDLIDSIGVVQKIYGLEHGSAKQIVFQSDVWKRQAEQASLLTDQLWEYLRQEAKDSASGITIDSDGTIRIDLHAKGNGDE